MGGEEGERGACGDRVGATSMLLPQILGDDAVKGWGRRQVALQLLLHGWGLITRENSNVINGSKVSKCFSMDQKCNKKMDDGNWKQIPNDVIKPGLYCKTEK